jgi:hypothetical protein
VSTIPSESQEKPRIKIDTQNCTLTEAELEKMDAALAPLRRIVERFPVADLLITVVRHARSHGFHVKTSLLLPGKTLFTGEQAAEMLPGYLRCVRKLVRKVEGYKARLQDEGDVRKEQKGTHQVLVPDRPCDWEEVSRSVEAQDYAAFRRATLMYEDALSKRIGRWIQRYPEAEVRLEKDLTVGDVVEDVFLNAFEDYSNMPKERRFADWLEDLIDPSLRAVLNDPDQELQNISFARTLREQGERGGH